MPSKKEQKFKLKGKTGGSLTYKGSLDEEVIKLILQCCDDLIQRIKARMEGFGMIFRDNININVENTTISIEMPKYYQYVDEGVNGTDVNYNAPFSRKDKKPPLSAVKEWMMDKGIPIQNGSEYAMQNGWHTNGIYPHDLIGTIFDQFYTDVNNILLDNIGDILIDYLQP